MIEAATRCPRRRCWRLRARPRRDHPHLRRDRRARARGREAQVDRRRAERRARSRQGEAIARRIAEHGIQDAVEIVDELLAEEAPQITMESGEDDIVRELQVRNGLKMLLESKRLEIVENAVRAQFESDLRALTDAEQDSKELKSRKRDILYGRIIEEVQPRSRSRRASSTRRTRSRVRTSRRPPTRSTATSSGRRSRSTSVGPTVAGRRRSARSRPSGRLAADARLGALHARPDADPHALHARHRQGAAADRRPLHGDGAPLHAPLQLPAVLGGRDRLHARPKRRASATGARAAGLEAVIRRSRTSRTRSASSPRRSSRTARRRWARSAARRCP